MRAWIPKYIGSWDEIKFCVVQIMALRKFCWYAKTKIFLDAPTFWFCHKANHFMVRALAFSNGNTLAHLDGRTCRFYNMFLGIPSCAIPFLSVFVLAIRAFNRKNITFIRTKVTQQPFCFDDIKKAHLRRVSSSLSLLSYYKRNWKCIVGYCRSYF